MTERVKGFVVTLQNDVREDDIASTMDAIKHIKGVIAVQQINSHGYEEVVVGNRIMAYMQEGLWELTKKTREKFMG